MGFRLQFLETIDLKERRRGGGSDSDLLFHFPMRSLVDSCVWALARGGTAALARPDDTAASWAARPGPGFKVSGAWRPEPSVEADRRPLGWEAVAEGAALSSPAPPVGSAPGQQRPRGPGVWGSLWLQQVNGDAKGF